MKYEDDPIAVAADRFLTDAYVSLILNGWFGNRIQPSTKGHDADLTPLWDDPAEAKRADARFQAVADDLAERFGWAPPDQERSPQAPHHDRGIDL